MQDETLLPPTSARRPRSARLAIALVLLAFLGGGALVGWLAVDGRLAQWLPRLRLSNCYGATETTSPVTVMPAQFTRDHLDSVGMALPCAEIAVMD